MLNVLFFSVKRLFKNMFSAINDYEEMSSQPCTINGNCILRLMDCKYDWVGGWRSNKFPKLRIVIDFRSLNSYLMHTFFLGPNDLDVSKANQRVKVMTCESMHWKEFSETLSPRSFRSPDSKSCSTKVSAAHDHFLKQQVRRRDRS